MQQQRFRMAMLFPVLAVLVIATYAGGLGVIFMLADHYVEEWSVVIIGTALVIGVPTVAAMLQARFERR